MAYVAYLDGQRSVLVGIYPCPVLVRRCEGVQEPVDLASAIWCLVSSSASLVGYRTSCSASVNISWLLRQSLLVGRSATGSCRSTVAGTRLNVGDPASLKEFTLGTVDKKLRIVDCGNDVSRHPLAEARRGCKIRPRYARSSMDLSYIAHQTGYKRFNGPWYRLPALFLQGWSSTY